MHGETMTVAFSNCSLPLELHGGDETEGGSYLLVRQTLDLCPMLEIADCVVVQDWLTDSIQKEQR